LNHYRIGGSLGPVFDLESFIYGQTPAAPPPETDFHESTLALAYQIGNLYFLLMMIGTAVLYSTSERTVIRNYMIALAIADLGHVYAVYLTMGADSFYDVTTWSAISWGNIGATLFLFVNRIMLFLGWFGEIKDGWENRKKVA
jgi:hypothetical protein